MPHRIPFSTRAFYLCTLLITCLASTCHADSVRLPLNGYYHVGRWMPIEWTRSGSASLHIYCAGGITTVAETTAPQGIAPWLAYQPIDSPIHWTLGNTTGQVEPTNLHPLSPLEKLVAVYALDTTLASDIFPEQRVVAISMDAMQPLPGPAIAWQSLDAAVMSPPTFAKLSPSSRNMLSAAGITLAVTGENPPDAILTWTRADRLWIARPLLFPPPVVAPSAYAPIAGWTPGRSDIFRRTILFFAILLAIASAALALWRSPWMPLTQIALCAIAIVGIGFWFHAQSPVAVMQPDVWITGISPPIRDRWTFLSAQAPTNFTLPLEGITNPIFYDEGQPRTTTIQIICDPTGNPRALSVHLLPARPMIFITRQTDRTDPPPRQPHLQSPLRLLNPIYPHFRLAFDLPAREGEQWPDLIIEHN